MAEFKYNCMISIWVDISLLNWFSWIGWSFISIQIQTSCLRKNSGLEWSQFILFKTPKTSFSWIKFDQNNRKCIFFLSLKFNLTFNADFFGCQFLRVCDTLTRFPENQSLAFAPHRESDATVDNIWETPTKIHHARRHVFLSFLCSTQTVIGTCARCGSK